MIPPKAVYVMKEGLFIEMLKISFLNKTRFGMWNFGIPNSTNHTMITHSDQNFADEYGTAVFHKAADARQGRQG